MDESLLAGCAYCEGALSLATERDAAVYLSASSLAVLGVSAGECVLLSVQPQKAELSSLAGSECRTAAAAAWPRPKLPPGALSLGAAAWSACGSPAAGSLVRVYGLASVGCDAAPAGSPRRVPAHLRPCAQLELTLGEQPEAQAQRECGVAALEEALRCAVLTEAEGAPGTPGTPRAGTPATPARAQPRSAARTPSTPASGESAAAAAARARSAASSANAHWLRRAVEARGSAELLGSLAARCLTGRSLLMHAHLALPLLGRTAFCEVTAATPAGDAESCAGSALVVHLVTASTRVVLRTSDGPCAAPSAPETRPDASRDDVQSGAAAAATARAAIAGAHPAASFDSLGGVEDAIAALRRLVVLPLRRPELFAAAGLRPPRGVLLHGAPGTGKTVLAKAAAAEAGATLCVVSGPELTSEFSGESEARLRGVFDAAAAARPCAVVFIDEIDALCPARGEGGAGEGGGAASARFLAQLLTLLDGCGDARLATVAVIAATNRPEALDSALRRPGRFDAEVCLRCPSPQGRLAILEQHLRSLRHGLAPGDVLALAQQLHGFTGADLGALVAEASLGALRRAVADGGAAAAGASPDAPLAVGAQDFAAAQRRVRASGMREVRVEAPPSACWDDVAGLDGVKMRLAEALGGSAAALQRLGARPPTGVLLYGPPGCAKTSLARAVAARGGRNFIAASGADIYSMWVGQSERAVAALFARARDQAPCVLFLDELDALAPARSGGSGDSGGGGGAVERVLAQLLTELDGGVGAPGAEGVLLLAATNRPDLVDPALLRPGRLDRLLYVPPPQDAAQRRAVLAVHLRATPAHADLQLQALAEATEGYSGADLAALCREAKLAALLEDRGAQCVAQRHFATALRLVGPSPPVSQHLQGVYSRLQRG